MTATARTATPNPDLLWGLVCLALATAVPTLIAYSQTPSSTLYNQLAALFGWGAALLFLAENVRRLRFDATVAVLLMLLAAPIISVFVNQLPFGLALETLGLVSAALVVYGCATGLDEMVRAQVFRWFCWGLVLAGTLSMGVSLLQVFYPAWTNGFAIAHSGLPGRAVGNMRQPNHLASLMVWACVALAWLGDQRAFGRINAWAWPALLFGFVFTIVLSASRTGMWAGIPLLALWGAADARLSKNTRIVLGSSLIMFGVSWGLMDLWASSGHAFGAQTRLDQEGAGSGTRIKILANAWELVKANPWTGVGWGEFNLAWTMTPFPDRPVSYFDHTHNIVMQFAVELGLPATLLIVGLLLWTLWRRLQAVLRASAEDATLRSAALMLVLTIGVHSLLEYPLWYAYFLLPAAFAMGVGASPVEGPEKRSGGMLLSVTGALLLAASIFAAWDYQRIVVIYAPATRDAPLVDRVREGQRALIFGPLADYAAATSLPGNRRALEAAKRTGHNLIDARLMMDWAEELHEAGDDDRARYLAARLREFRNDQAKPWFAACEAEGVERPFQCDAPQRVYNWREMR
ncbi:Wzy polymerase domain-containing protein [Burkholderiaceae bacterium UC74_6]